MPQGHLDAGLSSPIPNSVWDVAEALQVGLVLLDREGDVIRANAAAEALLSPESGEEPYSFFGKAAPFEDAEEMGRLYRRQLRQGELDLLQREVFFDLLQCEKLFHLPEGERRIFMRFVPVAGERVTATRAVAILEDRTELALERKRRKRAESLVSLQDLSAGVAHEVNNPLTSLKAFAQMLQRDAEDEERRQLLARIEKEVDRVARLIDKNLSLVSDAEADRPHGAVDINALVREVVEIRRYSMESAGIEVNLDLPDEVPPVRGDEDDLSQVLVNLVVNAEEALEKVDRRGRIGLRTRTSSAGVLLKVVDNGPGIAPDRLQKIFEPFHTTKEEGTGLGLEICRSIVRDHQGEMWAESEEDEWTAFWIRLPRARRWGGGAAETPALTKTDLADGGASNEDGEDPEVGPLDVLVVDDEDLIRRALKMSLEDRGHRVTVAEDAYEGRDRVEQTDFDVAVMDVRMPGDGIDLKKELEESYDMEGRTLLLTGDVSRSGTLEALEENGPYMTKPFDFLEVARKLEELAAER